LQTRLAHRKLPEFPAPPGYNRNVQYRKLGSSGLDVSVVGLGTWQFGGEWGRTFSQAEADAILDEAAAQGINLIDTAECYGDHLSESLIGDYLSRRQRSRWIIATKFGHSFHSFMNRTEDFSPSGVRSQLEASLRALRVDHIDLYQFHSGSDAHFHNDALWQTLDDLKRSGRIRHIGISILGTGSELQAREARSVGAEVLQVVYNRLDRRPEQMYFPHALRDNLGVLARVPLASGLLSGNHPLDASFPAGDFRSTMDPGKLQSQLQEAARLRGTEVPPGVPMSEWALRWCLENPAVSAIIPGCKSPAQVRANAAAG
jgi:aryl-alcohol dehydrogenase-like predicted oxidoreductase